MQTLENLYAEGSRPFDYLHDDHPGLALMPAFWSDTTVQARIESAGVGMLHAFKPNGEYQGAIACFTQQTSQSEAVYHIQALEAAEELPAGSSARSVQDIADGTFDEHWGRYLPPPVPRPAEEVELEYGVPGVPNSANYYMLLNKEATENAEQKASVYDAAVQRYRLRGALWSAAFWGLAYGTEKVALSETIHDTTPGVIAFSALTLTGLGFAARAMIAARGARKKAARIRKTGSL